MSYATRGHTRGSLRFRLPVFHRLWMGLPALSTNFKTPLYRMPHNPAKNCFLGFGLFRFRSPLLTESLSCFLFLRVLRCFNSPRSLTKPIYSVWCNSCELGFPIRTPPDQSLVGGSPKLFAASRVLLRFSMPRHPPCALPSFSINLE